MTQVTRRTLLSSLSCAVSVDACRSARAARSEAARVPEGPTLAVCHTGFRPDSLKRAVISGVPRGSIVTVDLFQNGTHFRELSATETRSTELGAAYVVDFSDVKAQGHYELRLGQNESLRFLIRQSVWQDSVSSVISYQTRQRCGTKALGSGTLCHLDDACRRDSGEHVDVQGGWHDAGDLRKWVETTILNLLGLLALARRPESAGVYASEWSRIISEARYGNEFFLKMQDVDGLVWSDVGGGVGGDNSDNHWTDNKVGSADDRWINVKKQPVVQAMFIAAQAITFQVFRERDKEYGERCLNAALRCWRASTVQGPSIVNWAWWNLAAIELFRSTGDATVATTGAAIADRISAAQVTTGTAAQGYFTMWPGSRDPLRDARHSGLPALVLLFSARTFPKHVNCQNWRMAVSRYLDDYAIPFAMRSEYRIIPFGLFIGRPGDDNYRSLGGDFTYRYFMPQINSKSWLGLNSHLLSHALLFAETAAEVGSDRYRAMAVAQLEWIFGANPFGATLVTGIGYHNPKPFSPFTGPIHGGIMNGVCGNKADEPVLMNDGPASWRSNEYWSLHAGYYQWVISAL